MIATDIVNLNKYPIHQPESEAGRHVIEYVRGQLDNDGSCTLDEFINPKILGQMVTEAESLAELGYQGPTAVSPYFFNYDIAKGLKVDASHPTRHRGKRNLRQVASDLIPGGHLLSILYHSELMTNFLGRVRNMPIYQSQDKFQALNISIMDEGGCQQWHFDHAHMVTTLMLQSADEGGVFEYAPNIRSQQNENFAEVRKVLDSQSNQVKQFALQPGTLSLFCGHYSLHRVTEVQGNRRRILAALGYATQPDLEGNFESSVLHYGPRVAEEVGESN